MSRQIAQRKAGNGNEAKRAAAGRLIGTAQKYAAKFMELGEEKIEGIVRGQKPGRLVVFPSVGMARIGIPPVMNGVEPGNVFTVSCMENGELDDVAMGSLFYGFKHLGIREVSLHGSRDVVGELREGMEGNFGKFGISIGTYVYKAGEGGLSVHFTEAPKKKGGKPEGYIPTGSFAEPGEIEAVIVDCSDSRVMTYQVFKGHNVAVVSNAGNMLSPTAQEAINLLVGEVSAVIMFAHSDCGSVGAFLNGNDEAQLAAIMEILGGNIPASKRLVQKDAEIANVLFSAGMLAGMENEISGKHDAAGLAALSSLILREGPVVVPAYLGLRNGEVRDLSPSSMSNEAEAPKKRSPSGKRRLC
jgi:carbonic anhydrase